MNYYLRKNGAVTGPMSQQDFLARLASGEWSATDEMSTDGKVWTRLGITGFARSIREARFASSPRLGPVVGDLTGPKDAPAPQPSDESQKLPENASFPATPQPVYRRSSPAKKVVPVLGVLLVAALAALAWFLLRPREIPEGPGVPDSAEGLSPADTPQNDVSAGSADADAGRTWRGSRRALLVVLGDFDPKTWGEKQAKAMHREAAKSDLENFGHMCRSYGGWETETMVDADATVEAIRAKLAVFAKTLRAGDEFLLFMSSHGGVDAFCAYDANYAGEALQADMSSFVKGVKAAVVVNACHSGSLIPSASTDGNPVCNAREFLKVVASRPTAAAPDRIDPADVGWLCSSAADQNSFRMDAGERKGSFFASRILASEGWLGGAADGLADAVIARNGRGAVRSSDAVSEVGELGLPLPDGSVSFLDLAVYSVRKMKDVFPKEGEAVQAVPQFANPQALEAIVAGRTGNAASAANGSVSAVVGPAADGPGTRGVALSEEDKAAALSNVPKAFRDALGAYLFPPVSEPASWFETVKTSDLVENNVLWKSLAGQTGFVYDETDDEVNAYASISSDGGDILPQMTVLGGFMRYSRVIGAVMASGALAGTNAADRLSLLVGPIADIEDCSPDVAVAALGTCGVKPEWFLNEAFVQEACNLANGIGMAVVAHEMGHVCYGHVLRTCEFDAETTRNHERDADSFSFSVASSVKGASMGSVSKYMFLGNVSLMTAWAAQQAAAVSELVKKSGANTPEAVEAVRLRLMEGLSHPFAGERMANLLRSRENMAKQYGLDVVRIQNELHRLGVD